MTSRDASPAQLRRDLLAKLPAAARDAVERVVAAAAPNCAVYAVAGAVRDLFLDRKMVDLDLVMECDAPSILSAALPDAKLKVHARFRTASTVIGDIRIDVATARSETYAHPGALPRITPTSIETDLHRRDFAMNAIALRLSGEPKILDPCDGIADIAARRVRVLHDASFQDDATRIFRALRYAARLDFTLETHTAALLTRNLPSIDSIGGERLRRELELILEEATGCAALAEAAQCGALAQVHQTLSWDDERAAALTNPLATRVPALPYGFALLAANASPDDAASIIARLKLKRDEAASVTAIASMRTVAPMLKRPDAKPSGVVVLLDRFPLAAVAALAAIESDPIARQLTLRYLAEWRTVKPILRGDELIEMGVPAGPQVQRGLQLVRAARLDGWATDRDDERALVLRFAKSIRDANSANAPIEFNLN